MREDTLQRKVFMVNFDEYVFPCIDSSSEILIWDFGIKVGDTLPDCLINIFNPVDFGDKKSFVLDSIHMIPINSNQIIKHFFYFGVPPGICGDLYLSSVQFIEGFGMEDGPVYKRFGTFLVNYCEGTLADCNIISSTKDEPEDDIDIKIYPNPATDFISFYLDNNSIQKVNQYNIVDITGQLIKGIKPISSDINYVIHTHDFPSGIYFIQFLNESKIIQTQKFIISH